MDDRLDDVIDSVAREMTDAEPSAGLRASVLDAIERDGRRQAPAVPRWAWAGAAAGLVLAVATVGWLARPAQVPPAGGSAVAEHGPASLLPAGAAHARATAAADGAAGPATAEPQNLGATRTPAVDLAAARSGRAGRGNRYEPDVAGAAVALLPALPDITPLALPDVEPVALDVPDVDVAPLNVAPMGDIPALEDRSADNRPFERNPEERR